MADSFNKKEKQKKKQRKKQEKEQKKVDRQASSKGGKLEDMIAYVDEFGNFTSTPPDPANKIVDIEDIEVSIPKKVDEPVETERKGTITFFNTSKGYGFIRDHVTQESIFVHVNALMDNVGENDKVVFEVEKGLKGLNAVNVRLI